MTPSEEVYHLQIAFRTMSESKKMEIIIQIRDKAIDYLGPIIKKVPRSAMSDTVKHAFQEKGISLDWNLATTDAYEFYFQAKKVGLSKSQVSAATLLYACTRAIEDEAVNESLQKLILDAYAALDSDFTSSGRRFSQSQKERAKKPRGKVTDDGKTLKELIAEIVHSPENNDLSAKELWPILFSKLDELELDPEQMPDGSYKYGFSDKRKSITLNRFEDIVSEIRNKKS